MKLNGKKYDAYEKEVILEKGGEIFYVKVGNLVVDVRRGYQHSDDKEPCAVINLYPYENSEPVRFMIIDDKITRLNHHNNKTDIVEV